MAKYYYIVQNKYGDNEIIHTNELRQTDKVLIHALDDDWFHFESILHRCHKNWHSIVAQELTDLWNRYTAWIAKDEKNKYY